MPIEQSGRPFRRPSFVGFFCLLLVLLVLSPLAGPAAGQTVAEAQGIRFRLIPGGVYQLGSPASEPGRFAHEALPYPVTLKSFFIAETEITNAQYARFLKATGHAPPLYWRDKNLNASAQPVAGVSWHDAQAFAQWLTQATGVTHRLPTEAQWEAAARGGLSGQLYPWGNDAPDASGKYQANYNPGDFAADGFARSAPAGSYAPNGFGLFDMAGNVAEWCLDPVQAPEAGSPFARGDTRLLKGGSWYSRARELRCAARRFSRPTSTDGFVGFRVVRIPPEK